MMAYCRVLGWMHSVAMKMKGFLRKGDSYYQNFANAEKAFREAYDEAVKRESNMEDDSEGKSRKLVRKGGKQDEKDIEEVNRRFNEDIDRYTNGELPSGFRFKLGYPSPYLLSAGFANLPISMRASLLSRKAGDEHHPFVASELKDLVKKLQKPISIFAYSKDNMRNLIVDTQSKGKHFLVGVTLNYNANGIEINSVSGLFPKESHEWIKWILDGKAIRIDKKEKVLSIIDSLRTNPAESERIGLNLDSATKIVKDFVNPKIEDGSISENELSAGESMIRYSVRTKPAPKNTKTVYKLFKVDEYGRPHALFIDKGAALENSVWYDADCPSIEAINALDAGYSYLMDNDGNVYERRPLSERIRKLDVIDANDNGRRWMTVKSGANGGRLVYNNGLNGAGTVSQYALRPGWHATDAPSARHIGDTEGGKVQYRRPDERWFEVKISADKDYNEEARSAYMASHPKAIEEDVRNNLKGDITDKKPEDGFYNFRTNSNANPNQSWYIAGSIQIVRPISDKEATAICEQKGVEKDLPYKNGVKNFDETTPRKSIRQAAEEASEAYRNEAERPKPLMSAIRHSLRMGKRGVSIDPFVAGWDSIMSSKAFKLEESAFDSLKAVEEFQRYMLGRKDVPDYLNAHRALR